MWQSLWQIVCENFLYHNTATTGDSRDRVVNDCTILLYINVLPRLDIFYADRHTEL